MTPEAPRLARVICEHGYQEAIGCAECVKIESRFYNLRQRKTDTDRVDLVKLVFDLVARSFVVRP